MRPSVMSSAATVAVLAGLAGSPARADDFLNQEGDLWRSSKLVGVDLFGPGNHRVGAISDVLMDKDGKAAFVVVGVGGFLGIGQKDVAIPFDKVKFSQDPMPQPAAPADAGSAPGTMAPMGSTAGNAGGMGAPAANTGMAPNTGAAPGSPVAGNGGGGTVAAQAPRPAGGAMTTPMSPRSPAYPDHGMVDYTADQLKAAPAFSYAK